MLDTMAVGFFYFCIYILYAVFTVYSWIMWWLDEYILGHDFNNKAICRRCGAIKQRRRR